MRVAAIAMTVAVLGIGCSAIEAENLQPEPIADITLALPVTETAAENVSVPPTVTLTFIPTATLVPTITVEPNPAATAKTQGCQRPVDDYSLFTERQHVINMRTLLMLRHANSLYGGEHDFVLAITQGSYNPGVGASFGTHDGGGAVDISVRNLNDVFDILYDELDEIILALRVAGFAAWVREPNELYNGSALHIHAIAIGDRDLSEAARLQLTGPSGYFRGFNGLPVDTPISDKWGEPVICQWMLDLGYADLRGV